MSKRIFWIGAINQAYRVTVGWCPEQQTFNCDITPAQGEPTRLTGTLRHIGIELNALGIQAPPGVMGRLMDDAQANI